MTDNTEKLPANSTWYIMTKVANIKYKEVGNLYGVKNWVEYGLSIINDFLIDNLRAI